MRRLYVTAHAPTSPARRNEPPPFGGESEDYGRNRTRPVSNSKTPPTSFIYPRPAGPSPRGFREAAASTSARWPRPRPAHRRSRQFWRRDRGGQEGCCRAAGRCVPAPARRVLAASAALTAPQPSWPSTTNSGVCRWTPAYCSVPITSGEITLPATRTMNSSPKPASKISSGGTRESLQPRMVAYGLLALGELGEDLLLHGREPRFAADEALVAGDEARQRLLERVRRRRVQAHPRSFIYTFPTELAVASAMRSKAEPQAGIGSCIGIG